MRYRVLGQMIQDVAVDVEAQDKEQAARLAYYRLQYGSGDDIEYSHSEAEAGTEFHVVEYNDDNDFDISKREKFVVKPD